jgi:hypothetical protein
MPSARIVLRARDPIEQVQLTFTIIPLYIHAQLDVSTLDTLGAYYPPRSQGKADLAPGIAHRR